MVTDVGAPWAEPALITAQQLLALADEFWRYELVEGRLMRLPPTGFEHADVEAELIAAMRGFARQTELGKVVVGEPGFVLSQPDEPDTVLAPDIAFIRADRLPPTGSPQLQGFLRLCPDLIVEIGSPSQGRRELGAKAERWLSYGAELVWVVWPSRREVDVWHRSRPSESVTLGATDTLHREDVLPGFSMPVSRPFT